MRCKLIFHQIFENNIFFFIQVPIVKPPSLSDVLLGDDEFLLERRKRQSGIFTKNKDHYQVLTETGLVDGGVGFLKYFKLKPDF
jgi:hypothetical protein